MKKYIFFLGLFVFIHQFGISQNLNTNSPSTLMGSIPFELTAHNNISVEAILNGKDTVRLMFHTAASSITLIKSSADNIKSVEWNQESDVKSWGGESKARYSKSNSLKIGNFTWENQSIWETQHSGPTTDGKFGPNLFEGKIIEIDFDESIIKIHNSLPSKAKSYHASALQYENGFLFIEGTSKIGSNKIKNRFLIHSGYGGSILYDDEFVKANGLGQQLSIIDEKELKDSYGNVLKTKKATLPLFAIGGKKLRNIPVGFFEGSIGRQRMSVIGGDVLKRFNIIIDAEREYIYLKPNNLKKTSYTG